MTQQSNLTHKSSLTQLQCPKSRAKNLKLWRSQFCICSVNHSKSSHVCPLLVQPIFTPWLHREVAHPQPGRCHSYKSSTEFVGHFFGLSLVSHGAGAGGGALLYDWNGILWRLWSVIPGIDSCNRVMQTLRMIVSIGLVASLGILVASQQGYEVWDLLKIQVQKGGHVVTLVVMIKSMPSPL